MKGKLTNKEVRSGSFHILLSPKTTVFARNSTSGKARIPYPSPYYHHTRLRLKPVSAKESKESIDLDPEVFGSYGSSDSRRSYRRTKVRGKSEGVFLTLGGTRPRGTSFGSSGYGLKRTCVDMSDMIISQVSNMQVYERHNTLRLNNDLRSVLTEINKSAVFPESKTDRKITIAMEDKVKAWKEYTEENKRFVTLTRPQTNHGGDRTRLIHRKFLMASLSGTVPSRDN